MKWVRIYTYETILINKISVHNSLQKTVDIRMKTENRASKANNQSAVKKVGFLNIILHLSLDRKEKLGFTFFYIYHQW